MDNVTSLIPHVIALASASIGIVYLLAGRKKSEAKSRVKDYDVLIGLGAIWFITGLVSKNWGIWPIGLILLLAGLAGKLRKS